MKPRSIAFCTTELRAGGAERCLAQVASRIDRSRFRPCVFALAQRPPAGQDQLVQQLAAADVPVEFLGAERIWQAPRIAARLAQRLRDERVELLQTFLFHANALGALAARRAGVRRLVGGIRVAERQVAWHRWVQRGLATRFDRFVCVSDDVARFSAAHSLPEAKLVVIPNGIDCEALEQVPPVPLSSLGVQADRAAVCAIGRLDRQKRIDRLLNILAADSRLLAAHDLIVVGDGPQRAELERQAQELGLAHRVRFVGWRPDAVGILKSSDLLVHTAAWEGMANVVLEAMACERAVVVLAAEGMEQLLGPSSSAQMVTANDDTGFAARLLELLGNASRRAELGRANRLRAADCFGLPSMIERYASLYSELLS